MNIESKLLLDFRTKRSYMPVVDLVNELSKTFDVFLMPYEKFRPSDLNNNVVCSREIDVNTIKPDVVFSTYSSLLKIAYLRAKLKLPLVNYISNYMMMQDVFSTKLLALPNNYKLRVILKLVAFGVPKSLLMPEKLIVPNLTVEKELVYFGFPKDRMITLPWGLNVAKYENRAFCSVDSLIKNDKNIIVYTGPLTPLRFSRQLIYAFSDVLTENPNAHLFLLLRKDMWNHTLYEEITSIIRTMGLGNHVSIITSLSHEDYLSYISRATAVILPYFSSGIVELPPFTLLECMALSKPVITSRGTATLGIIDDGVNGFILPESSPSLSTLINFLIENKRKAYYVGQKAKMTVREKYSLTHFSRSLSRIIEYFCE